jgi:hypothetical protein
VLLVEATEPATATPSHYTWEPKVLDAGYEMAQFDGVNRFYAHCGETAILEALARAADLALDNYSAAPISQQPSCAFE